MFKPSDFFTKIIKKKIFLWDYSIRITMKIKNQYSKKYCVIFIVKIY